MSKINDTMRMLSQELDRIERLEWDPQPYATSDDLVTYFDQAYASSSSKLNIEYVDLRAQDKEMGETDIIKVMSEDPIDPELMFRHADVLKLEDVSKRDDRPVFRILDRERFETIRPELEKLGPIEFVDDYEMMDYKDIMGEMDDIV